MRAFWESLLYHAVFLAWRTTRLFSRHRGPKAADLNAFRTLDGFRKEF